MNVQGRLSNITSGLRSINFIAANVLILVLVRSLLRKIRHVSESDRAPGQRRTKQLLRWSQHELDHVTLSICLFPPLFFFYGLYYTDVLSAGSVLLAYYFFLHRQTTGLLLAGLSSLLFRQTNIFWIAIFLGGLEVVRSLGRPLTHPPAWTEVLGGFSEKVRFYDPLVSEACFEGFFLFRTLYSSLLMRDARLYKERLLHRNMYTCQPPIRAARTDALPGLHWRLRSFPRVEWRRRPR